MEADFDAKFCSVMEDPFSAHRNRPEFAGGRGNFKIISTFIDKPGLYRYQNSQMRLIIKRCKQPGFVICNLLNGTTYNKMSKNQAASTVNWRKILKKYLADSTAAAVSRGGVDPGTVALPLLRAAVSGNSPLIAALPELNPGRSRRRGNRSTQPRAGNRFEDAGDSGIRPGEAALPRRRKPPGARAQFGAQNGRFDLVIGSIHALLAPGAAAGGDPRRSAGAGSRHGDPDRRPGREACASRLRRRV